MKEYEKPQMEIIELSGAGVFTMNQSPEECVIFEGVGGGDDPGIGDDDW